MTLKSVSNPNSVGIVPVNWFVPKYVQFSACNNPISVGMGPDSLLSSMAMISKLVISPIFVCMLPVNSLSHKLNSRHLIILYNKFGIFPENLFRLRSKSSICRKFTAGKLPVSLLSLKFNTFKSRCNLPISLGTDPFKPALLRFRFTIRRCLLHFTNSGNQSHSCTSGFIYSINVSSSPIVNCNVSVVSVVCVRRSCRNAHSSRCSRRNRSSAICRLRNPPKSSLVFSGVFESPFAFGLVSTGAFKS
mmetsp:Transcript_5618/g.6906  ORF Transcript_5618/g.6906 Transcript_5618/m.6906 type:complete len:247 (-) Transcript_5618:139-879(-)